MDIQRPASVARTRRVLRQVRIVDEVIQDVHYAVRVLRRSPGFAVAAILIMALGIGANSAMFSLIHAVLLRDLPYPDAGRLVRMVEQSNNGPIWVAWPDFVDWRTMARSFESMGAVRQEGFTINGLQEPIRVEGQRATAEIFTLAGASLAEGRGLNSHSDAPGAPLEAVLSQRFSREHFANDTSAVGRMIDVDGESCQIVGVLSPNSRLFMDADIVVSFGWLARLPVWQSRGNHLRTVAIGKLKQGVSARSADTEMQQIARDLERAYPSTNSGVRVASTSLHESVVGDVRPMALTLAAAVGLLLLIACANVASLLLARVPARRRELALRMTLGAGRFRIARQLVTESVVLAMAGGAAGLAIGMWAVGVVRGFAPRGIPRLDTAQLDWTVLGVTFAVSLLAGVFFGLAPAWRGTRSEISESLQQGKRTASIGTGRLGAALTIAEVALSLLLLVAAGLLIRSFTLLLDVNPGFNPRGVLAVQLSLPAARYTEVRTRQFYRQLLERLASLPGETLVSRRATMALLSLFATLALVLAGVGIYGVLAYSVAQRTREFGIRMALGASRTVMIGQVLWRGTRLALSGVGVGLLLAPILTRFISTQLFGVGSLDPITFVASGATVVGFSLLACWIPARRASAVDPVQAMRAD